MTPLRYVYILGAGHSGSTLLAMLLGMHPRICSIGEVKAPALGAAADYRCSCGEPITSCGFWQALERALKADGVRLDLFEGATDIRRAPTPYLRRLMRPLQRSAPLERIRALALAMSPAWQDHLDRVQSLSGALARAACRISGKDVFVDSSKTGAQLVHLLDHPDLDIKVVRLVRDGRGVSLSFRKADGLSIPTAAYEWRRSNEEAERIVSRLPRDRWFDLRYERLCTDLDPTMQALFEFIGVEPAAPLAQVADEPLHLLGNDKARLNPKEVRLDEKWRRTLTPEDLDGFERVAGTVNRRLGYAS